jgi:hypothetical protein
MWPRRYSQNDDFEYDGSRQRRYPFAVILESESPSELIIRAGLSYAPQVRRLFASALQAKPLTSALGQ